MLIEKEQLFGGLSFVQKIKLKMHTTMCDACKNYTSQSEKIDKGLEKHFNMHKEAWAKLSKEAKASIIKALEEK